MKIKRILAIALGAALAVSALATAQNYPTTNPVYQPAAILPATTLTAAGTVAFQNNGNGTMYMRVAGTNSVIAATVEVSDQRAGTPVWSGISMQQIPGPRVGSVTANGLYRLNVAGAAQVRFNLASFTGTNVIVSFSAGLGNDFVTTLPSARATYSITTVGETAASSATDFLTVTGSASKIIRITKASCSGIATAIGAGTIVGVKRSTPNTSGTAANTPTIVPLDSINYLTPAATVTQYIANPTTGTLVGNVAADVLVYTPAATTTISTQPLRWQFGFLPGEQEVTLRNQSQVFALNGNGATLPSGHALNCTITWTEE